MKPPKKAKRPASKRPARKPVASSARRPRIAAAPAEPASSAPDRSARSAESAPASLEVAAPALAAESAPAQVPLDVSRAVDATEIPQSYGTDRLVLLVQSPRWAYAFWDISEKTKKEIEKGGAPRLRLVKPGPGGSGETIVDFPVSLESRSWYIRLPKFTPRLRAEIGHFEPDPGAFRRALASKRKESARRPHESHRAPHAKPHGGAAPDRGPSAGHREDPGAAPPAGLFRSRLQSESVESVREGVEPARTGDPQDWDEIFRLSGGRVILTSSGSAVFPRAPEYDFPLGPGGSGAIPPPRPHKP